MGVSVAVAAVVVSATSTYMAYEGQRKASSQQEDMARAAAEQERREIEMQQEAERRKQEAMQRQIELKEEQFEYEKQLLTENVQELMSTQRAGLAAAGLDVSSGSPLAIKKDTERQFERESTQLRKATDVAIENIQREITESEIAEDEIAEVGAYNIAQRLREASLYRQKGKTANTMKWLGTTSSLLSGGYTQYLDYKTGKGFFA